jgi:serine/threonine protein kinase
VNRSLPPPEIPGLTYQGKLGAGGYADVYLYAQHMPARKVAVKVMREAGLTGSAVARFTAEANAMAQLEHPHIVPVYAAGVTPDGRPYLVMMYYPRASLSERVRGSGPLPVPEVLRIGIQIGSAVETAHRAGLLHRDIKPANVLTSQYDTPGLTDFGIAAQIAEVDDEDTGVSVPWSPPEVLYATAPATARSDVYSLAATLWHLLVGRSPFEVPGGENATFDDEADPGLSRPGDRTSGRAGVAGPAAALGDGEGPGSPPRERPRPRPVAAIGRTGVAVPPHPDRGRRHRRAQGLRPAPGDQRRHPGARGASGGAAAVLPRRRWGSEFRPVGSA